MMAEARASSVQILLACPQSVHMLSVHFHYSLGVFSTCCLDRRMNMIDFRVGYVVHSNCVKT